MRKFGLILLLFLFLSGGCSKKVEVPEFEAKTLRLTTTTSVNDSGLMEYLRPYLLEETNISLEIVSLGSGAALEAGQRGDADVLLVHSPAAENQFIEDGYGLQRMTFMYNFFVVVGPKEDVAGIKDLTATDGFKIIWETQSTFISRGDKSGTNVKEIALWKLAGIESDLLTNPSDFYISAGVGMGDTLMMASEMQAYTLTDLSTFLSMKDSLSLEVLINAGSDLRNDYSIIVINPDKVSNVDTETAKRFETWMTQPSTLKLISSYGEDIYGEALFFVNE